MNTRNSSMRDMGESRKATKSHKRSGQSHLGRERNDKKKTKHQKTSKNKTSKRVEVKWNFPVTEDCDFATIIKGYNDMSSTEKLKAKTKYLEQRYGAISSLEDQSRFANKVGELIDNEDINEGITSDLTTGKSVGELSHEDAIFGSKIQLENTEEQQTNTVLTEEVVESQKTTSWRERAAWRQKQRTGSVPNLP